MNELKLVSNLHLSCYFTLQGIVDYVDREHWVKLEVKHLVKGIKKLRLCKSYNLCEKRCGEYYLSEVGARALMAYLFSKYAISPELGGPKAFEQSMLDLANGNIEEI